MTTTRTDLPILSESDLETLEALFPPRCLETGEGLGQHLRYAGRVDLIADLRAARNRNAVTRDDLDAEIRKALAEQE